MGAVLMDAVQQINYSLALTIAVGIIIGHVVVGVLGLMASIFFQALGEL